jgi:ribokinase
VLFLDEHGARTMPAPKVDVVDATGAGDAFVGALAAALARGDELEKATRWGIAAAALSTTVAGARSAPSVDAITGLLAEP